MIIDTHCHLDFDQFHADRDSVIERAEKAGVKYFINVGSSLEGSRKSVELASRHDSVFASVGIHPHEADHITEDTFTEIEGLLRDKKIVAIGEIGLDYFKKRSAPDKQKTLFTRFIEISKKRNLPLIIHNRDAARDTLDILKKNGTHPVSGVMHCFSGDEKFLGEVLEMGLHVSFTCNLTFKNAKRLREVAKGVPLDRLLLETDAPFLAPQAYRGKRNEPAYIIELRDVLSEILNVSKEEIEKVTTDNAKKLFKIPG
ncbi:MAG: TatD family hydrolase [Candidatus Omnitrophica bacterium]|nr:TatD family hydrolase [Candidatus Omnitrophota bacterium]